MRALWRSWGQRSCPLHWANHRLFGDRQGQLPTRNASSELRSRPCPLEMQPALNAMRATQPRQCPAGLCRGITGWCTRCRVSPGLAPSADLLFPRVWRTRLLGSCRNGVWGTASTASSSEFPNPKSGVRCVMTKHRVYEATTAYASHYPQDDALRYGLVQLAGM